MDTQGRRGETTRALGQLFFCAVLQGWGRARAGLPGAGLGGVWTWTLPAAQRPGL